MEQPSKGLAGINNEDYQPSLAESNVRSVVSHSPYQTLVKQFRQYIPKSNIIDVVRLRESPNLKIKKFKESAYYGEIVNGKRHGQGIMIYNNERVYEGLWENDYKQGKGFEQFSNKSIYVGQFVNGKPQGKGKYCWPNGQSYEGEWLNGLKHGSGVWKGAKGDSYAGQWRMGKADGFGAHTWINGDRYQGQFKHCLKHGQGIEKFANEDLYKGQYFKGKPHGYGEYYWSNGSYFKGNFKQGMRCGHGLWKKGTGNSDKYQGEYVDDKKHGYGIFTWATGNIYKGNYVEQQRQGHGEMYWSDGSYYKGQWKKGIQEGQGVIYTPGQGEKKGMFANNVLIELYEEENQEMQSQPSNPRFVRADKTSQKSYKASQKGYKISQKSYQKQFVSLDIKKDRYKKKTVDIYQPQQSKTRTKSINIRMYKQVRPPLVRKQIKVNQTTNNGGLERIESNKLDQLKTKDRIPHSSYYIHRMYKRVSTAHNQSRRTDESNNRGEIVEELKSFTRKINNRNLK